MLVNTVQIDANTVALTVLAIATALKAYYDNKSFKYIQNVSDDTHRLVNNNYENK